MTDRTTYHQTSPTGKAGPRAIHVWLAGLAGCLFVVVAIVLTTGLFHQTQSREAYEKQLDARPGAEAKLLREEQLQSVSSYRWLDQQAGVVAIPIEQAMSLMVAESGAKP